MSAIPMPWAMFADEDGARDDYVWRVDNGLQCPECGTTHGIRREASFGIPLFVCTQCNAGWFDVYTRPTIDPFAPKVVA
jgi:transposase-like protein